MENNTKNYETIVMLIKFYNLQAGTAFRFGKKENQDVINEALERVDVVTLKNHIRKYVVDNSPANTQYHFMNCFKTAGLEEEKKVEEVQPQPQAVVSNQSVASSLGILEQAVVQMISQVKADEIKGNIMGSVQEAVNDFIKREYGTIERKIKVTLDTGKEKKFDGIVHEKFDTVLKFVANDEPVFLVGPAGSGKNVLCKQIAETLGLNFYFTNAVTQEYKLTGFTDAMGNYQPTQFYKAFTEGGVFMLDEMDASIPEVLVILNAAIANRYFDFPAPIGYKEAHPDFRIIAAGNTIGHGADYEYVGRSQLDAASLDRFAVVEIGYSEAIENGVAGDIELADFCREFRKSAKKAGVQVVVSYRAIGRLAKMLQLLDTKEALLTCLLKGLERDDVNMIYNGINMDSKYKRVLKQCIA